MPTTEELLAQLVGLQREQVMMTRFLAFGPLKQVLQDNVRRDQEKIIFENSTGLSTREVAEKAGVGKDAVLGLWAKWAPLGIVTEIEGQPGRYQRICSLREIGMEAPQAPSTAKAAPKGGDVSTSSKPVKKGVPLETTAAQG